MPPADTSGGDGELCRIGEWGVRLGKPSPDPRRNSVSSENYPGNNKEARKPDIDHETAEQYLSRALDFMHGAGTLCSVGGQGWLPSSALLIAQAMELVGKRRLILNGAPTAELSRPPNNHDLRFLWGDRTGLRDEARQSSFRAPKEPVAERRNGDFRLRPPLRRALPEAHSNTQRLFVALPSEDTNVRRP
jgi:hypothetical protein